MSVRPLGGIEDLSASVAITPGGNLWVALTDTEGELVLAYRDVATSRWATHRLLREGGDMIADEEVVWLQSTPELIRFDGQTLAVFSPGGWLDNIGLGNDGILWVTIRHEDNGIYRLVIDEESIE